MNKNSKDFINLISSFLNGKHPKNDEYNWNEIYSLSKINDVTCVIANEMKILPLEIQPTGRLRSYFNQSIGLSIRAYDCRNSVKAKVRDFFISNNIDFLFVKGCEVCELYPQPEFRTSGDIDAIVREDDFDKVMELVKSAGFESVGVLPKTISLKIDDLEIEIHKGADVYTDYFSNIFDVCNNNGHEYMLDLYNMLLYIILHLAKHLKSYGAGVRMLMDIDVCIRAIEEFDEQKFVEMCEAAGIRKCCEMLLTLCNYWFDTPVKQYTRISDDSELMDLLEKSFLYGGTFGFHNNNIGAYYLSRNANEKVGVYEKIKAVFNLLFPKWQDVRKLYFYSEKYNFLTPFAYINRLFDGIFKRTSHSIDTAKKIIESNDSALLEVKIMKELEIDF